MTLTSLYMYIANLSSHLSLPPQVEISFYLLRRLLGVKTSEGGKQAKVHKLAKSEILMVNIGSTASGGKVLAVKQVSKVALL